MRLKPVIHPRRWLVLAIVAYAVSLAAGLWDSFSSEFVTITARIVVVWAIGVPASLLGSWGIIVWNREYDRRRRVRRGHCAYCDYDLNGNVGVICLECGTSSR